MKNKNKYKQKSGSVRLETIFNLYDKVYVNGKITINNYPQGNIGVNNIRTIDVTNLFGTIIDIELPNSMNSFKYLYYIKFNDTTYGIEISSDKLSYNFINKLVNNFYDVPNSYDIMNSSYNTINHPYNTTNSSYNTSLINTNDPYNINNINNLQSKLVISNNIVNLNNDINIQTNIIKYYYKKIINKWLYNDLIILLAYVNKSNNNIIDSYSEYDITKLSIKNNIDIKKKINFMKEYIITRKLVKHVLKKIVKYKGINWYDLHHHAKLIKKMFLNYISDLLKRAIKN